MKKMIFFGASTGRTGTMHLANVFNAENDCTCSHEGKFRIREDSGEQILPFLTLENRIAYEYPEKSNAIIAEKRSMIKNLDLEGSVFGDIAYNNSPFLCALAEQFEDAKFILLFRDGRSFVRSATVADGVDETPVGWPPGDKPLTQLERYISLGRLQPRRNDPYRDAWEGWDAFQKNTWLWTETNRLILSSLEAIDPSRWMIVHFETFVGDKLNTYAQMRKFVGIRNDMSEKVKSLLLAPKINSRKHYSTRLYEHWDDSQKNFFWNMAGEIMEKLGYETS